jgi:hypothetical protein
MMSDNKDIAPLVALLKMAACEWPSSEPGEVSESELFRRDQALLEMWPEACRRVGLEEREFPSAVIERCREMGDNGMMPRRGKPGHLGSFRVLVLVQFGTVRRRTGYDKSKSTAEK